MKDWSLASLIILLAILVVVPLLAESYLVAHGSLFFSGRAGLTSDTERELELRIEREQERESRLQRAAEIEENRQRLGEAFFAWFECDPRAACRSVDFDKDGVPERLTVEKLPQLEEKWLSVTRAKDEKVLLLLPFNDEAGDARTRLAVFEEAGETRLVVYDQVSYAQPLEIAYRYDGERMKDVYGAQFKILPDAESVEGEALMFADPAPDDGSFPAVLKLLCYYFVLTVLVAVVIYKRENLASGGGFPNFLP